MKASLIIAVMLLSVMATGGGSAVASSAGDGSSPINWQAATEIATGKGERGPWQQNDSRYDYIDDATVVFLGNSQLAIAWVDQARKDVLFQRVLSPSGKALGPPLNISRSPATFSWLPRLAVATDMPQKVFVLWQEIIFSGGSHGGDILFSYSDDGGAHFSAPANLSDSVGGDGKGRINRDIWHNGSFDLAAGADGKLVAAWTDYDGALWVSRSGDGGKNFSRPARIETASPHPARAPSVAFGQAGEVYMAWTTGEDPAAAIRVAVSTDGGATFAKPLTAAPAKSFSDSPKLAVDARGTVHLAYAQSVAGPFDRHAIRYIRSTDGARSFETPRAVSGALPAGKSSSSAFPSLALNARGDVLVLWEMFPDHRGPARGLALSVSRDGGRHFSAPHSVPSGIDPAGGINGSLQGLLMKKLALNERGEFAVIISSIRQGLSSRVRLISASLNPP